METVDGPRGLPFFGNAFQITPSTGVEITEIWAEKFKPLCFVKFPNGHLLLVNDYELNEKILRARPESFRRWSVLELIFEELSASGLFSAEGEAWKVQRRLVMHAFSQRHLKSFFPTLRRVSERLLKIWNQAAKEGSEIDTNDDLKRFTCDVTVNLAFSTDINSLENGEEALNRHLSLIFPTMGSRLNKIVPYWRFIKMPADRRVDRALLEIRKLQSQLVTDARDRLAAREKTRQMAAEPGESQEAEVPARDMLEAMLLARDENGQPFSEEAIYGNMLTMLLAGEDTTAYALSWAMHFLCERPDVLQKMRSEVDEFLGDSLLVDSLEVATKLRYCEAVAQETLRLKSPAPVAPLENNVDIILGDVFVPKGTFIQVMTRAPALEETKFSEAESFRPERWLDEIPAPGVHHPRTSIPFGSGPRICPGRSLALLEMRMVLALLARNFEITRVGAVEDVRETTSFVLTPVGVRVKLSPRRVSQG